MGILVFGDQFYHRAIVPKQLGDGKAPQKIGFERRYDSYCEITGAPFVAQTINFALSGKSDGAAKFCEPPKGRRDLSEGIELVDVYEYCNTASQKERALRRVSRYVVDLRLHSPYALLGPRDRIRPPKAGTKPEDCRTTVFFDYNGNFRRRYISRTGRDANGWIKNLCGKPNEIIIGIGDNFDETCLKGYKAFLKETFASDKRIQRWSNSDSISQNFHYSQIQGPSGGRIENFGQHYN